VNYLTDHRSTSSFPDRESAKQCVSPHRAHQANASSQQAEHQRQKDAILKESEKDHTADRFVGVVENIDDRLKRSTVGLVTLSDFQRTKESLEEEARQIAAKTKADQ
jgi:hypothetical protein